MRDRLIELLGEFPVFHSTMKERWMPEAIERLADHLLAEGVIVLPCKVGITLYFLCYSPYANKPNLKPSIYESNLWYFDVDDNGASIKPRWVHGFRGEYHYYLGKTVFLTREEAEAALKEREGKQ